MMVFVMKNKLKQVHRRGVYDVHIMFNPAMFGYRMLVRAVINGDSIAIGELTFHESISPETTWGDLSDMVHVNDQMKATLMLLYGELTS